MKKDKYYKMLCNILAIIVIVQGVGCNQTNISNAKNDKSSLKRIGFIHITKTGGTAIEKSIYAKYLNSFGHKKTIANFSNPGDIAVCVLRDPVSRIISIYNYWRHGSEMYQREVYWRPPVNSLNEFLDAWRDKNHPQRDEIMKSISKGRGFTWAAHFYPQSHWLTLSNELKTESSSRKVPTLYDRIIHTIFARSHFYDRAVERDTKKDSVMSNIIIIRHSERRQLFSSRVTAAFTYALNISNTPKLESDLQKEKFGLSLPVINVSKRLRNDTITRRRISSANMRWLEDFFKKDFEIIRGAEIQFREKYGPWKAVF